MSRAFCRPIRLKTGTHVVGESPIPCKNTIDDWWSPRGSITVIESMTCRLPASLVPFFNHRGCRREWRWSDGECLAKSFEGAVESSLVSVIPPELAVRNFRDTERATLTPCFPEAARAKTPEPLPEETFSVPPIFGADERDPLRAKTPEPRDPARFSEPGRARTADPPLTCILFGASFGADEREPTDFRDFDRELPKPLGILSKELRLVPWAVESTRDRNLLNSALYSSACSTPCLSASSIKANRLSQTLCRRRDSSFVTILSTRLGWCSIRVLWVEPTWTFSPSSASPIEMSMRVDSMRFDNEFSSFFSAHRSAEIRFASMCTRRPSGLP
mmetsp:Transcript_1300/g.3571  ORF Transcript_1300/g.3571 Transcript_1300/m.3571 type:complete len:331 (+) Transcript_1300:1795-2787(+)